MPSMSMVCLLFFTRLGSLCSGLICASNPSVTKSLILKKYIIECSNKEKKKYFVMQYIKQNLVQKMPYQWDKEVMTEDLTLPNLIGPTENWQGDHQ